MLGSACGPKLAGTFVGHATVYGGGYPLDQFIDNITITLANKSSSEYYVTFGENSPVQCKLLVDNQYSEDVDESNDSDLYFRRIREGNTCEFRGKDGKVQSAKVSSISGGRQQDGYLSVSLVLETEPSYFNFSYQGWPPGTFK